MVDKGFDEWALVELMGPASIYAITPMSKETALEVASRIDSSPISAWDARRLVEIEDKRKSPEIPASIDYEIDYEIDPDNDEEDDPGF